MNQRIEKLRKSFEKQKIDALLVTEPLNIRYLAGFVGLVPSEREAYVLVTNHECYLITDSRYIEQAHQLTKDIIMKKDIINLGQKRARALFCPSEPRTETSLFYPLTILEIRPKDSFFKLLNHLMAKLEIKRLGFEANNLTFSEYRETRKEIRQAKSTKIIDGRGPKWYKFSLIPTKNLVENLRATKEPEEIKKMKKAARITDQCFEYLLKRLRPGLTESQVAWEIEKFIKEKGAELAFKPIVAAGPNSSIPHHIPSKTYNLKPRTSVLLDFGAKVDGYCSDMTRVVFLGKATREQKRVYKRISEAQEKAIEKLRNYTVEYTSEVSLARPRRAIPPPRRWKKLIKACEVDKVARQFVKQKGFPEIPHGLGHGVGLSEHEKPRLSPRSKDLLKPGMVFTIEPGVYLSGKFGIRIEDLVLLEKEGIKVLSKSSKEIINM